MTHPTFNRPPLNRMNYLTGHLKANTQMLAENRYCIDIIRQNQAVIAALKKVNEMILKRHLDTCVVDAVTKGSPQKREATLAEIIQVFKESEVI